MALITSNVENINWIIDSGSSSHTSYDEKLFTNINDTTKSEVISANANILTPYGSGDKKLLNLTLNGETNQITLTPDKPTFKRYTSRY